MRVDSGMAILADHSRLVVALVHDGHSRPKPARATFGKQTPTCVTLEREDRVGRLPDQTRRVRLLPAKLFKRSHDVPSFALAVQVVGCDFDARKAQGIFRRIQQVVVGSMRAVGDHLLVEFLHALVNLDTR